MTLLTILLFLQKFFDNHTSNGLNIYQISKNRITKHGKDTSIN